jgi:pyrroline-5-carboxylate reductase
MNVQIGFIGTGFMGTPMVKGIAGSGLVPANQIHVFDIDQAKLAVLKKETGVDTVGNGVEVVEKSDIIILAVKPNFVKPVLEECKGKFDNKKILVSIAAGIPIKSYKDILGQEKKIVRTMPNQPALVGEGMTLVSYDANMSEADKEVIGKIMECMGKVETLEERLMSEVIALTSSSPAYVFMMIEAMSDAAVLSGIPRAISYKLAAQAVLGSAKMVLETGKHPGELKDQVCSPAGTTIEAVSALEKNGFRYAIMDAMHECTKKARELGKIYG